MANTARKPKPEQPKQLVFELRAGASPDLENGAKVFDWWIAALSWPPATARRRLAALAKIVTPDTNINYFAKSLSRVFKTVGEPTFAPGPRPPARQILRIM